MASVKGLSTANKKRRKAQLGKRNSNYKGGHAEVNGYDTLPTGARGGKRVYAHRVKAHAPAGTAVHHVDHNRANNSRGNLKVTRKHPGVKGSRIVRPK